MQAKISKFIAAVLVLVIVFANSWSVVSYAAEVFLSEKELENQNTTSKDGSVDFDVQYTNGKHSATLNIDEKNTKLNIAVSLKKSGYVKDLAIDFSSSNFEIAQINEGSPLPFRPPYRFLVNAYQIAGNNLEKIFTILKNNSQLTKSFKNKEFSDLNETELKQFQERVDNVVNWLDTYAPKFVKFQVQEKSVPKLPLTDEQTEFLGKLADLMESKEFNKAEDLHDAMYEILEGQGLKPQKGFQAIYKMILGQKQGPRAASFLLSLDKDFVVKRLRQEA